MFLSSYLLLFQRYRGIISRAVEAQAGYFFNNRELQARRRNTRGLRSSDPKGLKNLFRPAMRSRARASFSPTTGAGILPYFMHIINRIRAVHTHTDTKRRVALLYGSTAVWRPVKYRFYFCMVPDIIVGQDKLRR